MIKVEYDVTEANISWEIKWDGKFDNDPLLADHTEMDGPGSPPHPFSRHMDYLSEERNFLDKDIPGTFTYKMIHGKSLEITNTETGEIIDWGRADYDFYKDPSKGMKLVGDCVSNNPVTLALIKMISDDEYLKKHSGFTLPYWYRCSLIGCLSVLWD